MAQAVLSNEVDLAAADAVTRERPYGWILHPAIDLMLCCGGLVWIFFALYYFGIFGLQRSGAASAGPATGAMVVLITLLTHLFSNSHTAATLVRLYESEETRTQLSLFSWVAPIAFSALAIAGLVIPGAPAVFLKIYVLWVIQHYLAQTYGIALIYCYKRGYLLAPHEKRALWLLMHAAAAYAILRQFVYVEWGSQIFLGHQLPFWGPLPEWVADGSLAVVVGMTGVFVALIVRKGMAEGVWMPFPALFVAATGLLIHFFYGSASFALWLFVPALYHGSQYLVVTTAYHLKEQGLPEDLPASRIAELLIRGQGIRYLGLLVIAGAFIYVGLPRILEELGIAYASAVGVVFAVFNFHHFATDAAIWRLRNPRIRERLVA